MRSIERRNDLQKQKRPMIGDFVNLKATVKGQKYSKITIARYFEKLVDPDDFDPKDKISLINDLYIYSNIIEDNKK